MSSFRLDRFTWSDENAPVFIKKNDSNALRNALEAAKLADKKYRQANVSEKYKQRCDEVLLNRGNIK